jgi:hypothetical protein
MIEMIQRFKYAVLLIILFAGGLISGSHAQSRYDSAFIEMAKSYPENLVVFTDRTLYAVNENIQFSALLQSGGKPYHGLGSTVLYAELVNSTGNSLVKGKFQITENRSTGHLGIPSSLLSGIYYLRCYTRWMRNFGSREFSYLPIRVVNPYSKDVAEISTVQGKNDLSPVRRGARLVTASTARQSYHAGEIVDVEFSLSDESIGYVPHACISVVPSGAIDPSAFMYKVNSNPERTMPFHFNFLPEIHGTTISGVVLEKSNQKPAPDTRIHFSILGEEPAYFATQSDQGGRFLINTPSRIGDQEMFVVPEYQSETPIEVRIDNDFSADLLPFDPGSLDLKKDEQALASRMSLHMQLQRAFLADLSTDSAILTLQAEHVPFYGRPEISVKMDEFVNLPNLEEVIGNLIPRTFVTRSSGDVNFMITSENPMISMFPPLILIDHIPVFDMEVIMAIPPSKIDHIDVIPEVYILGDVKYGGILSFTSRQGDLASIKLPEGSYFFDYAAYEPSLIPQGARYSGLAKIPDTRNTFFWADHLELRGNTPHHISFQAPTVPGSYVILFRGLGSDGNIVYGLNYFDVE